MRLSEKKAASRHFSVSLSLACYKTPRYSARRQLRQLTAADAEVTARGDTCERPHLSLSLLALSKKGRRRRDLTYVNYLAVIFIRPLRASPFKYRSMMEKSPMPSFRQSNMCLFRAPVDVDFISTRLYNVCLASYYIKKESAA